MFIWPIIIAVDVFVFLIGAHTNNEDQRSKPNMPTNIPVREPCLTLQTYHRLISFAMDNVERAILVIPYGIYITSPTTFRELNMEQRGLTNEWGMCRVMVSKKHAGR